jgi:hypothetical protein
MRSVFVVALLLLACGDPEELGGGEQQGGNGGQAAGAGGQSAGTGGAASSGPAGDTGGAQAGSSSGGGAGGASCAERWSEYEGLAKSARLCDPNAATPECKFNVVVLDACACSVPANGSSPDYAPARQRLTQYAEDCDFPEECTSCPSTLDAGCKTNAAGVSQCEYQ